MQGDEKPTIVLQQSIGKIKTETKSIAQLSPSDPEKPHLRRKRIMASIMNIGILIQVISMTNVWHSF